MNESKEIVLRTPPADVLRMAAELPPRNLPEITNSIKDAVISIPGMSKKCIYCRPVGKNKRGKQKFIIGPSIRLAEFAHQIYGRIWINGNVEETETTVTATVMAFDMITLNTVFDTCSKSIKGKYRYSQNQVEVTKAAALAIARRNVIRQLTNVSLEASIMAIKEKIVSEMCPEGKAGYGAAWKNLVKKYSEIGVSESEMTVVVENEANYTDKLVLIIGIYNAIRDGVVDPKEVFEVSNKTSKPKINKETQVVEEAEIVDEERVKELDYLDAVEFLADSLEWSSDDIRKNILDQFGFEGISNLTKEQQKEVVDFMKNLVDSMQ